MTQASKQPAGSEPGKIVTEKEGSVVVLRLLGEIGIQNSSGLDKILQKALSEDIRRLVVDLTETTYITSRGISYLVAIAEAINGRRGRFALAAASERVSTLIISMGLKELTNLKATRDEALQFARAG